MTRKTLSISRRSFGLSTLAFGATALSTPLRASTFPTKPLRLVVPFGAGGATDLAARALANVLPEYFGQPVAVVNVPGAGGAVGLKQVIDAEPDGYTMIMAAIGANALRPALSPDLPYAWDDATYIARTQINPNVLIVRPGKKYQGFNDFSEMLKSSEDPVPYGTAGAGQVTHLGPIMLAKALGLPIERVRPVHYDSDNAAMLALLQGEVEFVQGNLPSFAAAIEGEQVMPLAVTTPERLESLPDTPAYTELGLPEVSIVGWRGVAGPKTLPDDVRAAWEAAVKKVTESEAWLSAITSLGDEPGYLSGAEFSEFVGRDYNNYRNIAEEIGLRP